MASSRDSFGDAAAGSLVGLAALIVVAVLVFAVWLMVRIVNCVIQAFTLRPRSRMLRGCLAAFVLFLVLAALTQWPVFGAFAWLAFVALAVASQAVVLTHRPTFAEPQSTREFLDDVVKDWWPQAA